VPKRFETELRGNGKPFKLSRRNIEFSSDFCLTICDGQAGNFKISEPAN
jgi:hypothetical protein